MAKSSSWTFVTPAYIAKKRFKGIKTPAQVKNFATENRVTCGWWKKASSSSTRSFLIEFSSFQKAHKTFAKSNSFGTSKKASGRPTHRSKGRKSSRTSSRSWSQRYFSRKAA